MSADKKMPTGPQALGPQPMMVMPAPTPLSDFQPAHPDTLMLDWLIHSSEHYLQLAGNDQQGWFFWDLSNGLVALGGVHKTSRQAIAEAMQLRPLKERT
jgi:hypothetical protein